MKQLVVILAILLVASTAFARYEGEVEELFKVNENTMKIQKSLFDAQGKKVILPDRTEQHDLRHILIQIQRTKKTIANYQDQMWIDKQIAKYQKKLAKWESYRDIITGQ